MRLDVIILPIVALFVLCSEAASLTKEKEDEMLFVAITETGSQDLEDILKDYQGDINEKIYSVEDGGLEIMLSPFDLAAFCHKPDIMSFMIETKHLAIDMNNFDAVFKSNCVECFDVLLGHSNMSWTFNRKLVEKIFNLPIQNDHFMLFISRFLKHVDFIDQLALIENAFNSCTDQEKLFFTIDAVILDISFRETVNETLENDKRAAIFSFTRSMIFKKDFDDMFPWISSQYYKHPETEISKTLIKNYSEMVKAFDDRVEKYPQPEEIIKVLLENSEFIKKNVDMKTLLGLTNTDNGIVEKLANCANLSAIRIEMNNALEIAVRLNLINHVELLIDGGCKFSIMSIFEAISNNSAEMVELLLKRGADPNSRDASHNTALKKAIFRRSVEIVELLLNHKAKPDGIVGENAPPLIEAISKNSIAIVDALLKKGANPNLADVRGNTPLMYAVSESSVGIVDMLLKSGANTNTADEYGNTALIIAAKHNSPEILELLVANGADKDASNNYGSSPLLEATKAGLVKNVELLLKNGVNINCSSGYYTPLLASISNYSFEIFSLLLKSGADPNLSSGNETPLILAASNDLTAFVDTLLDYGAKLNVTNSYGNTALIKAAQNGSFSMAKLLLFHGDSPNAVNGNHETPLIAAVGSGSQKVVELLLDYGAEAKNAKALVNAVKNGSAEIVEILLKHGSDPNITDCYGSSPLVTAAKNGSFGIVEILLKYGADPNISNRFGETPLIKAVEKDSFKTVALLLSYGAYFNVAAITRDSPLMKAAYNSSNEILSLLLKHGTSHSI